MEIRLKTADEFHDGHVTIEIKATQEEAWRLSRQFLPATGAENVLDQAERAGKVPALEQRIRGLEDEVASLNTQNQRLGEDLARYRNAHVCTDRCQPNAHVAFEGRQLVKELERERDDAQTRVGELDAEVRRVRQELERRFTTAQVEDAKAGARADARADAEREMAKMVDQLGKISGLALGSEVSRALEYLPAEPGTHAHTVSVTLRRIRATVTWGKSAPTA